MLTVKSRILITMAVVLYGCSSSDSCENFRRSFDGRYHGVVLTTQNGDAMFARTRNCAIKLSGSYEFHSFIAKEWTHSNYPGLLRPTRLDISGILVEKVQGGLIELKVEKYSNIPEKYSEHEVREQFKLLLNRNDPKVD